MGERVVKDVTVVVEVDKDTVVRLLTVAVEVDAITVADDSLDVPDVDTIWAVTASAVVDGNTNGSAG